MTTVSFQREKKGTEGQPKRIPDKDSSKKKMLRFSVLLFIAVLMSSTGKGQRCLRGAGHKPRPTHENYLQECTLYAKSTCCYANITEQLADSPVVKVHTTFWNRCGTLSPECEAYMKKMECFYRCAPYIAYWALPKKPGAIYYVPMCRRFCDNWYEACKSDHTCVSNWLTDWEIDDEGENHCQNDCILISEMYSSGTDMCEKMWGSSLKVDPSPCFCLEMDEMDLEAIKFIQKRSFWSSSSSSSSSDMKDEKARFCHLRKQMRRELEEYKSLENNIPNLVRPIPPWLPLPNTPRQAGADTERIIPEVRPIPPWLPLPNTPRQAGADTDRIIPEVQPIPPWLLLPNTPRQAGVDTERIIPEVRPIPPSLPVPNTPRQAGTDTEWIIPEVWPMPPSLPVPNTPRQAQD